MLSDLGMAAACTLAVAFAWAGAAKLGRRRETAAGFADLRLPRPGALALVVPVVELALAVALLAAPAVGGTVAVVLLAAFTTVLVRALRRGGEVRCACFGQAGGAPLSWVDLARNGLLVGLALLAVTGGLEPRVPSLLAGVTVVLVAAASVGLLGVLRQGPTRARRS